MPNKRPAPSPADMNKTSKEFWDKEETAFHERIKKRPADATIAVEIIERRRNTLRAAFGPADSKWIIGAEECLEQVVADLAVSHEAANQERAKKATAASVKLRKGRNFERDRAINNARAAGKTPAQIAGDDSIFGSTNRRNKKKEAARLKTVYRVLGNSRSE